MANTPLTPPRVPLTDPRTGLISREWYRFLMDQTTLTGGSALSKTDDSNVTLTLGGFPATALLSPVSLTLGWNGQLPIIRGGTGANTAEGARDAIGAAAADHDHDGLYQPVGSYAALAHTHAESDVTGLTAALAGKAASVHNHDDLYYTDAEVDALLAGKSDTGHDHDSDYSPIDHTHSLDDLSGVAITSPSAGQVLKYDGANWVNDTDDVGSSATIPKITYLASPNQSADATARNVVMTGYDFQSGCTVGISGTGITVNSVTFNTPSQLTVNLTIAVGATAGLRNLTVTNPDTETSTSGGLLNVTWPAPTVTGSYSKTISTTSDLALTGTLFITGCTVAITGATVNSVTFVSATSLTVNITTGSTPGAYNITVTNPDAQTSGSSGNGRLSIILPEPPGYVMSGSSSASVIEKLIVSTRTRSVLSATMPTPNAYAAGASSATSGYQMAGGAADGSGATTVIRALLFSAETTSTLSATVATAVTLTSGIQSTTKGYKVSGVASGSYKTAIDALTYASETTAAIVAAAVATSFASSVSGSDRGYSSGGYNGSVTVTSVRKLTYASEATATIAAVLAVAKNRHGSLTSATEGYFLGATASVEKFTYSTDARTAVTATSPVTTDNGARSVAYGSEAWVCWGVAGSSSIFNTTSDTFTTSSAGAVTARSEGGVTNMKQQ